MDWKDALLYRPIAPFLKAGLWLLSRSRLPRISGSLEIKGLQKPVQVLQDRWGIPHIFAENAQDLFFAQGFVHARERFWQMDFTRRVVQGRLAEVVGKAGLPVDRAFRTVSLFKTAEEEAEMISGDICEVMNAYCAGVNTWREDVIRRHKLPVEFSLLGFTPEEWQVKDILGWGKMMCWTLAANWQSELYRRLLLEQVGEEKLGQLELNIDQAWAVVLDLGLALGKEENTDPTDPYAGPRVGEGVGSNSWVVHGSRTATGMPLLANDMHLELTTPAIWFENHLSGGGFDVSGASLPGVPMVIAGHNQKVAWGFTDSMPDTQDLFEEHLHPAAQGTWEYEYRGEWLPAEVRREEIRVKGGETVVEEVVVTRHGPVINVLFKDAFPDVPPMALKWTALEPDHTFRAFRQMNLAQNCAEFHEALREFDNPSQNVVFADIEGNIGYTMNGRIPLRAKGDGTVPAPGWTGEYEWQGYIPFEELPHLENPARGYIATANNQVEREDFPHFLGRDYLVSERAGRIVELIERRGKVDLAYLEAMQYDQVAISARAMAKALGELAVEDPELSKIVEKMRKWDGNLDKSSIEASIFEATIREAGGLMLKHHFGELGKRAAGDGPFSGSWPDHLWEWFVHLLETPDSPWFDLGQGEKRGEVLLLGLRQAVDYLKKELGAEMSEWKWGRIHQLTFGHRLGRRKPLDLVFNLGPFPIGGDGNTINASFTSLCNLNLCPVVGPPFRMLADLSDLEHCRTVLAPGQSGHLASRHYSDGIRSWFTGGYHPMLTRREDIELNLEGTLRLLPREEKKT